MAYYKTEPLLPIGSYYQGRAKLRGVGETQVVPLQDAATCPKGYQKGVLQAGGVSVVTPVCVERSFNALHIGVAGLVGFIIGKML